MWPGEIEPCVVSSKPSSFGTVRQHLRRVDLKRTLACPLACAFGLILGLCGLACRLVAQAPQEALPASPSLASVLSHYTLVDLTHSFDERTIYWPTEPGFQLIRGPAGVTEKGYFYAANRFAAPEHGGTHIDAPIHFFEGRQTVDEIPLENLAGEGAVIDVRQQVRHQPDYQVTVTDLRRWEEQHARPLTGHIVLLRTGYAAYWGDRQRYLGTTKTGREALAELRFPGLHPDAALWLAENRRPKAVGIDTASIDYGPSELFQSHVILFRHNIPVFENVADMSLLPAVGSYVVALPMKIGGGTGGPLRIVAWIPKQQEPAKP